MKHSATRELFDYWDAMRGTEIAPARDALAPGPIRHLIGDMFLLSCEKHDLFPLRLAGTRVCGLAGRDIKGHDFLQLWNAQSRRELHDLLDIAVAEQVATVAGVTVKVDGFAPQYLELLLLPFAADPAATHPSVTGSLVPLTTAASRQSTGAGEFILTTWRHLGYRRPTIKQRAIRKLAIAKGFMIYEGSGRDI